MSADSVWVRTEPSVDGSTYVTTLEFSDDVAVVLTPDTALAYASAVLAAAVTVSHDAAVYQQLSKLVSNPVAAGQTIVDLRADRPPLPDTGTPLRLEPGVTVEGKPFLRVQIDGETVGQWTPDDARQHALHVIQAPTAADLDSAYFRFLTGTCGTPEASARGAIGDLAGRLA